MSARVSFDYAIVRVVPRVDRGELLNAGVVLYCLKRDFLEARLLLDEARLVALWPAIDAGLVRSHLDAVARIAAGDATAGAVARLTQRERWHWIVSPRSTIIQMSPVHSGLTTDPTTTLAHLVDCLVRTPTA
ncbi:MAG: DUF3037 domain-containing protein [Myxococcota bacterium]